MKKTAWLVAGLSFALVPSIAGASEQRKARQGEPSLPSRVVSATDNVIGTITYDTGTNFAFQPKAGTTIPGNRFDSALGGPLKTGMVTMFTVFPGLTANQSFTFWGPPNSLNSAMTIAPFMMANIVGSQFNAVTLAAPVDTGPSFLVTLFGQLIAPPGSNLLGMDDMTINGQGFHAIIGTTMLPNLTMVAPIPNRNALLRVSGSILTPVELMDFEVR
jgi:hypothetical protein